MLLKLIKTRSFISGSHCEVWEINHETGNRLLGEVFVLNEHLPLELIYRVTVTIRGICIQGRHCGWQWESERLEIAVTEYLKVVQECHEEIRIEVCEPTPNLPGYPEVDFHPESFGEEFTPIIVPLRDLRDKDFYE